MFKPFSPCHKFITTVRTGDYSVFCTYKGPIGIKADYFHLLFCCYANYATSDYPIGHGSVFLFALCFSRF